MTPIESVWLASLGSGAPAAELLLRAIEDTPAGGALIAWSDLAAAASRRPSAPALRRLLAHADWQTERTIEALAASVVRSLATELLPIHERTNGRLGRVAARLPPGLGADGLLEAAERLTRAVNRQNLIPAFPATEAGLEAAERSIIIGQPVLVGAAASLEALTHSLEACSRGLRRRAERGLAQVSCLVAFDPEPVTAAVESDLAALGGGRAERAGSMRGKTLPALLQLALAQHAAALAEVPDPGQLGLLILAEGERLGVALTRSLMVGLLAGEEVGNIPDAGLRQGLTGDWAMLSSARAHLDALAALGISVAELGRLADEQALILETDQLTRLAADEAAEAGAMKAMLGDLSGEFPGVLQALEAGRVSARLWRGDTTLWTQDPAEADEAARRLGWLLLPESMAGRVGEFEALRSQLMAEGYRHAVVLGMGGSSLAPDVFRRMLPAARGLELHVLDSTDPEMVAALARTIPVETTLFLVSSKSGTTTEPLALFEYFWAVAEPLLGAQTGKHFAAITDPGTPLQKLAQEHGFRASFAGPADVGGRYSALSAFGLVPAALLGADVRAMLAGGEAMARACGPTVEAAQHPGLQLGAFLGLGAEKGRDKLTFLSDGGCDPLEDWIEQLVAESSGKKGRGLLPITHETPGAPEEYGADRLFTYLRRTGEFDARAAGALRRRPSGDGARRRPGRGRPGRRVPALGVRHRRRLPPARHQRLRSAGRAARQGPHVGSAQELPQAGRAADATRAVAGAGGRGRGTRGRAGDPRRGRDRRRPVRHARHAARRRGVVLPGLPADGAGARGRVPGAARRPAAVGTAWRPASVSARATCTRPASTTRAGRTGRPSSSCPQTVPQAWPCPAWASASTCCSGRRPSATCRRCWPSAAAPGASTSNSTERLAAWFAVFAPPLRRRPPASACSCRGTCSLLLPPRRTRHERDRSALVTASARHPLRRVGRRLRPPARDGHRQPAPAEFRERPLVEHLQPTARAAAHAAPAALRPAFVGHGHARTRPTTASSRTSGDMTLMGHGWRAWRRCWEMSMAAGRRPRSI